MSSRTISESERTAFRSEGGFAALRDEVKELFFRFVDSSNEVFWISQLDPERQVYVNRAVERMWGIPRDHFYSQPRVWAALLHPDDEAAVLGAYERWLTEAPDSVFDVTFRIILPNSQLRWVHDRGIWISRETDGNALLAGIATDVTESRLLQVALQERERQLRELFADRERISQDLHDDILQSLYAVGLDLETQRRVSQTAAPALAAGLQGPIERLNRIIAEIRTYLRGMESGLLPGASFVKALEDLAASMGTDASGPIALEIEDAACSQLPTTLQIDLLNIIREAASNSMRHSAATEIRVTARRERSGLTVEIVDNGRGFRTDGAAVGGLGIRNMRARAQRVGAEFGIVSDATGTRIRLYLPLP